MLKMGLSTEDLEPMSLKRFYLEGSLKGVPRKITEVHFASREAERRRLLAQALEAYDTISNGITQDAFVKRLYTVDPETHREVLLSREREPVLLQSLSGSRRRPQLSTSNLVSVAAADPGIESIVGIASPTHSVQTTNHGAQDDAEDDDGAAARRRIEHAMKKQKARQEKYVEQLSKNAKLLQERAQQSKVREEIAEKKHEKLVEKRRMEAEERQAEQVRRKEKMERIRTEAVLKEKCRQKALIQKIQSEEQHARALAIQRHEVHLLRQEERKIREEQKELMVERREKQHDYENLLLIDRIRRKVGRAEAMQQLKTQALADLKVVRERNAIEMAARTEQFASQLLEFERKHLS